jgi:hypothetical protein
MHTMNPCTLGARAVLAAAALLLSGLAAPLCAQDNRPTAFTNARILPMKGAAIERGTLVVKNGKIVAVGADVAAPAGARIVDCEGGTLMPGLVSAHSRAGFAQAASVNPFESAMRRGGRRGGQTPPPPDAGGRGAQNTAATKVVERLDPKQEIFAEMLRAGVTTLALTPSGDAFPGFGAILKPDGKTLDALTLDDDAFVFVSMQRDSRVKKTLKDGFDAAKKAVDARKAPKEAPKPEAKEGEQKPAEPKPGEQKAPEQGKPQEAPKPEQPKPQEQPKPDQPKPQDPPKPEDKKPEDKKPEGDKAQQPAQAQPKPEEKKDPNVEVLADLLEGKRKAIVQIGSAADLLHWMHAVGKELTFPRAICAESFDMQSGSFDLVVEELKAMKSIVLVPPSLNTMPRARFMTNPCKTLHDAGIEVGFVLGDAPSRVRIAFVRLMELVRHGFPREAALAGVTVVPSKALGVDASVGTLETGKKANLLLFSGDPLDPTSELRSVWLEGQKVQDDSAAR